MSVKTNMPPMWLSAKTPEELRLLMLRNNAKFGRQFHYFDFSFSKGKWYCWFEVSETERMNKSGN